MPGIEYASDDELRAMGPPERGASWRERGHRPLAGLAEPDYGNSLTELRRCPGCAAFRPMDVRECVGGTFACWERRRVGIRHLDCHCPECGQVWTDRDA